jgi:hypothetical protein
MSSLINPKPVISHVGKSLCAQCWHMCHDGPHVCTPDLCTAMLPLGPALIPNITPTTVHPGMLPLKLSRISRLASHIEICLFCPLSPHCALSGWSTHPPVAQDQARLTLEFFEDELLEKKVKLVFMSILSITITTNTNIASILTRNFHNNINFIH